MAIDNLPYSYSKDLNFLLKKKKIYEYYLKLIKKLQLKELETMGIFFKKSEPSHFDVLCHLEGPKNESRCEFVRFGLKCSHVFMYIVCNMQCCIILLSNLCRTLSFHKSQRQKII